MNKQAPFFTKVKKVKPTHVGQKCPVCNGYGTVSMKARECHACMGKGYILIPAVEIYEKPSA